MSPTPPIFAPPDDQVQHVLSALIDPERTLRSVAERFQTTVQALALWMQRPDIAERLNALSAATAFRARNLALDLLPSAVSILRDLLNEYAELVRRPPPDPKPHRAAASRRHAADGARRTVSLLTRLARLLPPTITPTPTPPPPQRTSPEGEDRLERSDKQVGVRGVRATQDTPEPNVNHHADNAPSPAPSPASGTEPLEAGGQPQAGEGTCVATSTQDAEAEEAPRRSLGCAQGPKPPPVPAPSLLLAPATGPPSTTPAPPTDQQPPQPPPANPRAPYSHTA